MVVDDVGDEFVRIGVVLELVDDHRAADAERDDRENDDQHPDQRSV